MSTDPGTAGRDRAVALLETHLPEIRRLVRRRLGGRLGPTAESMDLAQSVARGALENMQEFEFRGDRELRNWILTLADRKIVDWIRAECAEKRGRHLRRGTTADGGGVPPVERVPGESGTPSAYVEAEEGLDRLRAAIRTLPDDLRRPLVLHRLEGLPYEEVARRLGLTHKQARRRVAEARLALARGLGGGGP